MREEVEQILITVNYSYLGQNIKIDIIQCGYSS